MLASIAGAPIARKLGGQRFYGHFLQRYNEAIALDYVIPFRVLPPARDSGFFVRVQQMLRGRCGDRW